MHDYLINLISEYCLYLDKRYSEIGSHSCRGFESGCHGSSFPSYELFERKSLKENKQRNKTNLARSA